MTFGFWNMKQPVGAINLELSFCKKDLLYYWASRLIDEMNIQKKEQTRQKEEEDRELVLHSYLYINESAVCCSPPSCLAANKLSKYKNTSAQFVNFLFLQQLAEQEKKRHSDDKPKLSEKKCWWGAVDSDV